jgi:hypothetical protein
VINRNQAGLDVVEAAVDAVAKVLAHERHHLAPHRRELSGEGGEFLESPVVQVEGETAEAPLERRCGALRLGLQKQLRRK